VTSIRRYLLARLLAGAALVLALAAGATSIAVTRSLEAQFDENLSDRIRALSSLLFQTKDAVQFEFSDQLMPEYARKERPAYFELRYEDGRLLERSESLAGAALEPGRPVGPAPVHWTAPLPDGRSGGFAAAVLEVHHVFPEEGPDRPLAARVRVVVAAGREDLVAAERSAIAACAGGSLAVLLLLALLARAAVDRGLAPANRLAERLDAIRVEDLPGDVDPSSVGAADLPAELQPIGRKIEALLERTVAALRRERRTAADIAHELRTPISEIVTASEVALRDTRDPESRSRALGRIRSIAWRMGRSVSTLLKLARLEMGAEATELSTIDAGALVAEVLQSLAGLGRERGVRVDNRVGPGERVDADPEVLRIGLSNLLGNALVHAPEGAVVVCSLERSRESWSLVVENEAPGLFPEDLRSLSEPFWRKDRQRGDGERSGLGLALSRTLAERAGLELAFELRDARLRAELKRNGARASAANGHVPRADGAPPSRR